MWQRSGILVAFLGTVAAARLPATGTETHSFAPGGPVTLFLPVGTVTVHPGQQNRILLRYVVHPDHDGLPAPSDSMTLDFQVQQNSAEIRFNDPEKPGKHEPTVNIVLEAPAHTHLDLRVGVGKMMLASGWRGDLQLRVGVEISLCVARRGSGSNRLMPRPDWVEFTAQFGATATDL